MKTILKATKFVTLDNDKNKLSFFIKTKQEILKELETYSHIKLHSWTYRVKLATLHRCQKVEFVLNTITITKKDFIKLCSGCSE